MTLGLKYKLVTLSFGGARHHLIYAAHAEPRHTLSASISSLRAWSTCFERPFQIWNFNTYAEHTRKFLTRTRQFLTHMVCMFEHPCQIWNFYTYAEHTHKALMRMLRVSISSWCVCSGNAPVPEPYAQGKQQSLMHMLSIFLRYALLKIRLNIRVSPNWTPLIFFFNFVF